MPWRDDGYGTRFKDAVVEVFGIIGPVSDDVARMKAFDQCCAEQHLTAMARAGNEAQGIAQPICNCVQLGS